MPSDPQGVYVGEMAGGPDRGGRVRQFRKGPLQEPEGLTVYAKCVGEWIGNEAAEGASLLGSQLRRLRPNSTKVLTARVFSEVDVFLFDFGCVVVWGCTRPQLARVLEAVSIWVEGILSKPTEDRVIYCPASNRSDPEPERHLSCILGDTIFLSTESVVEKLAYSYGLAQGVKLDVFELAMAEIVDDVGSVPAGMAETGEACLTAKQAGIRLGEIFLLQYECNLRSDLLESPPDTFWDLDLVAPVYRLGRSYLDLDHRMTVLNKRLKFMRNMYTMLQSEAEVRASNTLGWIITLGVAGEVFVAALQMALMIWNFNKSLLLGFGKLSMAGRGTFAELRARLGVSHPNVSPVPLAPSELSEDHIPMEPLVSPSSNIALPSTTHLDSDFMGSMSPSRKPQQATGPQGRRKRIIQRQDFPEAGTVFAACLGSAFDLHKMVSQWRLGTSVAFGLSKLANRLEFLSEKADYPVVHGILPTDYYDRDIDIFVMEFGCVVCWGCSRSHLTQIIDALWPFLISDKDKRSDVWVDDLNFTLVAGREPGLNRPLLSYISKDNILLATDEMQERLAYSYAFAQSVKLDVFERGVSRAIEGMDDFPTHMAKTGIVKVSDRRRVAKKIGELMVHGCDVNLKSDVLEIPDILWDMDTVLPVYHLSRKYLDIEKRLIIVNHRLTVMQEMYAMIQEELTAATNVRIEWIIIVLICVNVVIEIVMMVLEWVTGSPTGYSR